MSSFYVDCIIIESLASQNNLSKHADGGMVMSLIQKIKEYVEAHIDPNDKTGSIINILAPGALSVTLRGLGFGWLGLLLGLAIRVFNIDVNGILQSIWSELKTLLGADKKVSSSQVDNIVQNAMKEHYKPATQEEAEKILKSKSFNQTMQDVRFIKLAMHQYQAGNLKKHAGILDAVNSRKAKTASILSRVLGWVFKVALASAGLMVAGDIVNKLVGRPNALDGTLQQGKPVEQAPTITMPTTTQTKFKTKPSYKVENNNANTSWVENVSNSSQGIGEMLVGFAKDVYDGLDGKENIIRNTPGFQVIRDKITWYNHTSEGGPVVFIPKLFTSKKQIVDYFIDDVAEKSS